MLGSFLGGAQDVGIADLTQDEIVSQVHSDLKQILLKPDAPDPMVLGVRVWKNSIPQFKM